MTEKVIGLSAIVSAVASAPVLWFVAQISDAPTPIVNQIGNLTPIGILLWYVYHVNQVGFPKLIADFRGDLREARESYLKSIESLKLDFTNLHRELRAEHSEDRKLIHSLLDQQPDDRTTKNV